MSRHTSGDPHPQPPPATQLPPLSFKHCRSSFSHSSHLTNPSVPGDPKAYHRFHGGIASQETPAVARRRPPVSSRPFLQPAGGFVRKTATANGGTGVFIPVYLNNNGGMEKGENQQKGHEEEIPIEMLLPSEWTY